MVVEAVGSSGTSQLMEVRIVLLALVGMSVPGARFSFCRRFSANGLET